MWDFCGFCLIYHLAMGQKGDKNEVISLPLPVTRPQINISASPASILAFGLESATITVQAIDPSLQSLPEIVLTNSAGGSPRRLQHLTGERQNR
jgi:hypothetical protein